MNSIACLTKQADKSFLLRPNIQGRIARCGPFIMSAAYMFTACPLPGDRVRIEQLDREQLDRLLLATGVAYNWRCRLLALRAIVNARRAITDFRQRLVAENQLTKYTEGQIIPAGYCAGTVSEPAAGLSNCRLARRAYSPSLALRSLWLPSSTILP